MLFSAGQSEANNEVGVGGADMTASESYDSAYQKYENAKGLVHQITDTINTGFKNVQTIITKYQSSVPKELITELSTEVNNTKILLKDLFSQDPGLFEPTQLEQQLDAYESEKQKGYQLVKNLQSQIESLQTEKQNWQLREQKGIKTMEEYKRQLAQYKNGTYPQQQQIDSNKKSLNGVIDDDETNGNQIQELEKELELAQTSFGDMRKMVDSLSSENKSLSAQVLTLREQVGQLTRRQLQAQAQIAQQLQHKNGYNNNTSSSSSSSQHGDNLSNIAALKQEIENLKQEKDRATTLAARYKTILNENGIKSSNLVRTNTENPMNDRDQESLKDELADALQAMVKEELDKKTMQMMNFADGTQEVSMGAIDEDQEDDDRAQMRKLKEEMEEKQGQTVDELKKKEAEEALKRKQDKLKTMFSGPSYELANNIDDDRDAMKKKKLEYEQQLGIDAKGARKQNLMNMIGRQDDIANSEQEAKLRSALNNNQPIQDIEPQPRGMVDLDARQEAEKKLLQEMNEEQQTMQEMQQAIAQQKQQAIFAQTERAMRKDNVDPDEELKKIRMEKAAAVYADPDENKAIRQAYKQRLTEKLDHDTNPANNITTTTITDDHEIIFEKLMQSIGIVNDAKKEQIWKQIKDIVHEDKDIDINLPRGHSVTRSMMDMDRDEIMDVFKQELEEKAAQQYVQDIEELKQENEDNINKMQQLINQRDSLQTQIDSYQDSLTKQSNKLNEKEIKINELMQELQEIRGLQQEVEDMGITPQGPPTTTTTTTSYLPDNIDDDQTPIQSNLNYETPIGPDDDDTNLIDPNQIQLAGIDIIQLQNQIETLKQEKINLKSHYDVELEKLKNDNKQEIHLLNDEIIRISKAKCQLVLNTSKEIDSLRRLLKKYNDAIPLKNGY